MATQKRQSDTALKNRLFEEFYRFSFFKAVGLLENLSPDKKPLGKTVVPGEEAVRFTSKPGLSFPASDISMIGQTDGSRPVDMQVTFMGLVGPSGVLPHCYNEQVVERLLKKDHSLMAFYDMFHHRLISLFYLAWKKYQLTENYLPEAEDRISSYILCLAGMGTPGLLPSGGLRSKPLVNLFSGLLSKAAPSACAIEALIGYISGAEVKVEQFIERMLPISPEDRTRIGMANEQLGVDAVCGSHTADVQSKFRVVIGPVKYNTFLHLLPGGEMLRPIFSLVKSMAGIEYEFDVRVLLARGEVPACTLGSGHPLLGETTWVFSPGFTLETEPYATFQEADA
ncbi:MAG: type VI secretion system baseplate subunit TssG [Nitrospirota bacterium]